VREARNGLPEVIHENAVIPKEIQTRWVTGVALRNQPRQGDDFVARPRCRCRNIKSSRCPDAIPDLEVFQLGPAVQGAEGVVGSGDDPLALGRPYLVHPLPSVPDNVRDAPWSQLAVFPERMDVEWPTVFEQ
jgi:hypothetical protein